MSKNKNKNTTPQKIDVDDIKIITTLKNGGGRKCYNGFVCYNKLKKYGAIENHFINNTDDVEYKMMDANYKYLQKISKNCKNYNFVNGIFKYTHEKQLLIENTKNGFQLKIVRCNYKIYDVVNMLEIHNFTFYTINKKLCNDVNNEYIDALNDELGVNVDDIKKTISDALKNASMKECSKIMEQM